MGAEFNVAAGAGSDQPLGVGDGDRMSCGCRSIIFLWEVGVEGDYEGVGVG